MWIQALMEATKSKELTLKQSVFPDKVFTKRKKITCVGLEGRVVARIAVGSERQCTKPESSRAG